MQQNSKHKNTEYSTIGLAREDLTPKNHLERERCLETEKETAATNSTGSPDVVCVNNMDKMG